MFSVYFQNLGQYLIKPAYKWCQSQDSVYLLDIFNGIKSKSMENLLFIFNIKKSSQASRAATQE